MTQFRVLLLAGTHEAHAVAAALDAAGYDVLASFAGATRRPRSLPVATRHGGFGGREAQRTFLLNGGFTAVIDASHPFAARISHRTAELCGELGLPYLRVLRPPWRPGKGEKWDDVSDLGELAALIPSGARVFLATGARHPEYAEALPERTLFGRKVDPGPAPFELNGGWVDGRPPFSGPDEIALFKRLDVDWLVAKNAGGPARAKLDAARELGVRVAMIRRPSLPDAPVVATVEDVLAWIRRLHG